MENQKNTPTVKELSEAVDAISELSDQLDKLFSMTIEESLEHYNREQMAKRGGKK